MPTNKKFKVCLACSAGGHLQEIRQLESFYRRFDYFFVSFRRRDTETLAQQKKVFFVTRPARNLIATLQCAWQSFRVLQREKPDVVVATGADVSVPICFIAKLFGKKVVFIESFCRPVRPGISGRLVYPIADLFIYQWPALAKFYPKAKFGGSIFESNAKPVATQKQSVFVTVGTHPQQFNRLLKAVDDLVADKVLKESVFAQTGASDYKPKNYAFQNYLDLNAFEKHVKNADFVISHGGEGNIGLAIKYKKKCIAWPRLQRFGEHTNDHQTELVGAAAKAGKIRAVASEAELQKAVQSMALFHPKFEFGNQGIVLLLKKFFAKQQKK